MENVCTIPALSKPLEHHAYHNGISAKQNIIMSPPASSKDKNHCDSLNLPNGTSPKTPTANILGGKKRHSRARHISVPTSPPANVRHSQGLKSPNRVGKYTIIRTLGKGNFAQVKLAIHVTTGREVAIKMIDKTTLNENCKVKLAREVKVLKNLVHPNIVRLYEVIETAHHVYLVMEYARNGEVFEQLLKLGRMAENQARELFRQLFSAVEYCHQKNIVHRDLKAENLLLDENNCLKLADFGFANTFNSGCNLDTFCGSPPYAAPELLSGQKYHGPEVDVWALGVILYMLVCGQLPFEAFSLKELHTRVMSGKYRIPFFLSAACESMLKKMLVLEPGKRATLKELMKEEWINIGHEKDPLTPYLEPPVDYNDPIRRAIMNELGFHPDDITDAFENDRFNNVTATYLLLADTETRHRITKRLQTMNGNATLDTSSSLLNGESGYTSENEDVSEETYVDGHERASSAFPKTGRIIDVLPSKPKRNWATGSLRQRDRTEAREDYLQHSKQMCLPSLDLPHLIADNNKQRRPSDAHENKTSTSTDYKQYNNNNSSSNNNNNRFSPNLNGLRRIRTSTLTIKTDENENVHSPSATKYVAINDAKVKTEPPTRRTFQPGENREGSQRRTRSIIIVSDIKPQERVEEDGIYANKPRCVVSPYSPEVQRSNKAYDLHNPTERDHYGGTNASGPGSKSRDAWGYHDRTTLERYNVNPQLTVQGRSKVAINRRHSDNNSTFSSNFITIEQENNPSRTIFSPQVKQRTQTLKSTGPGDSRGYIYTNRHAPLRQTTLETTIVRKDSKRERQEEKLPQWKRHNTDTPIYIERVPESNAVTKTLTIGRSNGWTVKADVNQGSLFSPPVRHRRTFLNDGDYEQQRFKRQIPASVPNSPLLNTSRLLMRVPSENERKDSNYGSSESQKDQAKLRLHEPLTVTLVQTYQSPNNKTIEKGNGDTREWNKLKNSQGSPSPRCVRDERHRQRHTPSRLPICTDERRSTTPYGRRSLAPPNDTWRNGVQVGALSPQRVRRNRAQFETNNDATRRFDRTPTNSLDIYNASEHVDDADTDQRQTWTGGGTEPAPRKQSLTIGIQIQGKNAHTLMMKLLGVLDKKRIEYIYLNPYKLLCTYASNVCDSTAYPAAARSTTSIIKWEAEVVQISLLKSYGIRFKHVAGDASYFRYLEKSIVEQFPKT